MSDGPEQDGRRQDAPEPSPPGGRPPAAGSDDTSGWYAIAGTGIEFLTAVGLFVLVGWWLDGKWNSFPWLTLAGAAVGFAAGLYLLIKAAGNAFRD